MNLLNKLDELKPAIVAALNSDLDPNDEFDSWAIEHVLADFAGKAFLDRQKIEQAGDKCQRNGRRTLRLEITLHSGFDVPEPEIRR